MDAVDGWFKWHLERDDGKQVKVNKSRYRQLLHEGRILSVALTEAERMRTEII